MNAQLSALGCKDSFRTRGGGKAGLWAASTASKTVPLDQGSVSGIMQHVSDESVRRQVRECVPCCHWVIRAGKDRAGQGATGLSLWNKLATACKQKLLPAVVLQPHLEASCIFMFTLFTFLDLLS